MNAVEHDFQIRERAFLWLEEQVAIHGDVLPRSILEKGFIFQNEQIHLLGPQGIFKPRIMALPLSITTTPSSPYSDYLEAEGVLRYRYRGTDPEHPDNVGLRRMMQSGIPLIYFHGIIKSKYLAAWPVFIVADNPLQLTFTVAIDDARVVSEGLVGQVREAGSSSDPEVDIRRVYVTRTFQQRIHQRQFRERVLQAYRGQCSLCRLRHQELLDAAHIIPDSDPGGEPRVSNGLALCKLHHAAFDRHFIGIREDYVVEVRPDVLEEKDGPMLLHGLQELQGESILIPRTTRLRPDPDLLQRRYEQFRVSG